VTGDLASLMAELPEPDPLPPGRLSRLQRNIITATAVAIYNSNGWDDPDDLPAATIGRTTAYEHTRLLHWTTDPGRSWERQERSRRTSFDRALATLHRRGFVWGLALAWVLIECDERTGHHLPENIWGWQGGGRTKQGTTDRAPTLWLVGLTDKGWHHVDVAGRPLGELLTADRDPATIVQERELHRQIAELVGHVAAGES
jgi:hypothetical protein